MFDASSASAFKLTLTGNVTSSSLVNAVAGEPLAFEICQDATGGRTFIPPVTVQGWVTVPTAANACILESFVFDGTNALADQSVAGLLLSSSTSPATAGAARLASGDSLDWRNNANTANIGLAKTGAAGASIPADTLDATAFGAIEAPVLIGSSPSAFAVGPINAYQRVVYSPANTGFEYEFLTGANAIAGLQIDSVDAFETAGPGTAAAGHARLWPDSTSHLWKANNNAGTSYNLVGDTTTQTLTNKTLGGTTALNRLRANQGTPTVIGDWSLVVAGLGSWGSTASVVSVMGNDTAGSVNISCAGTGQSPNPGFKLTFHDGAFPSTPVGIVVRGDGNGPTAFAMTVGASSTAVTFGFSGGLCVSGTTYTFYYWVIST